MRLRRVVVAAIATSAVALPPAAASAVAAPTPLVDLVGADVRAFSPNGDGAADRVRYRFDLLKRSSVLVRVYREGDVVRKVRLGTLPAGRHTWRWNGKVGGEVLPDGTYYVSVRAWSGRRTTADSSETHIVTTADAGRLVLSRSTLYPAATVVHDRLVAVYMRAGYIPYEDEYPWYFDPSLQLRYRLLIRDPDGDVVRVASRRSYKPVFSWDARDQEGKPLPAGAYRLTLTVADPVGNVRTVRRSVRISHAELTEQVWSQTTTAATTVLGPDVLHDPGCNGCPEVCGPVPSQRFVEGLSFLQPCTFGYAAVKQFSATPPVQPAPVDSYRVTVSGGPPDPGGPGIGHLDGVVVGPGDATATTPWRQVDLTHYPYLPDASSPIFWGFSTSEGNDYDVASFTVEYRHYVPVE